MTANGKAVLITALVAAGVFLLLKSRAAAGGLVRPALRWNGEVMVDEKGRVWT